MYALGHTKTAFCLHVCALVIALSHIKHGVPVPKRLYPDVLALRHMNIAVPPV